MHGVPLPFAPLLLFALKGVARKSSIEPSEGMYGVPPPSPSARLLSQLREGAHKSNMELIEGLCNVFPSSFAGEFPIPSSGNFAVETA